jgi:hypothetical protein
MRLVWGSVRVGLGSWYWHTGKNFVPFVAFCAISEAFFYVISALFAVKSPLSKSVPIRAIRGQYRLAFCGKKASLSTSVSSVSSCSKIPVFFRVIVFRG